MRSGGVVQEGAIDHGAHQEYFDQRLKKAAQFCRRFDGGIDFRGKRVLDFGCGHGALSVHAMMKGAKEVVGLDANAALVGIANAEISRRFTQLASRVKLQCRDMKDFHENGFDIVVSQATFEHVMDPKECLRCVKESLKEGGRFYLGFGPLYYAPWGDHRRTQVPFQGIYPWAHLCFSQDWIVKHYNGRHPQGKISSIKDLGLNGLKFREYVRLIEESGLHVKSLKANCSDHPMRVLINAFRRIPGLCEFLTFNVYAVLEK